MKAIFMSKRCAFLIAVGLFVYGCTEDTIVFPEEVEGQEYVAQDRGPVKQTQFQVVTENDTRVQFHFTGLDTERVRSVVFSYNRDGEQEDTEVTDFSGAYIISNLPMDRYTTVQVWAIGYNGLSSGKADYPVIALPSPAQLLIDRIALNPSGKLNGRFSYTNSLDQDVVLHIKADTDVAFRTFDLEGDSDGFFEIDLPRGIRTITYYLIDDYGITSREVTATVLSYEMGGVLPTTGWEVSASSIEIYEGGYPIGYPEAIIDGDINTYWHSTWWPSEPPYPHWLVLDLKEQKNVAGLDMIGRHNNFGGGFKTFNLAYSNDNTNWTTIQNGISFNSASNPQVWNHYEFPMVQARYIRITATEPNGAGASTHLAEVKLYEGLL